jgi:hypothetical protein
LLVAQSDDLGHRDVVERAVELRDVASAEPREHTCREDWNRRLPGQHFCIGAARKPSLDCRVRSLPGLKENLAR